MDKSQVCLVTGGAGGIGREICRRMAVEGFTVIAGCTSLEGSNAREFAHEIEQNNLNIVLRAFDVSDFDVCQRTILDIEETVGQIAVLVNNAGITRDGTLRKMSRNQWDEVLSVNLDSVFNLSRAVINPMLERQYGRIINISSINGQKGQFGQCNYAAAKAAMYGFSKSLAQETASKGITVNCISPGYIETDMILAIDEPIRESIRKQIPVQRFGQASEVARSVAFLAAPEAGFITGANLAMNGGQYMD
ncbi:MAG: acetoacetyl-CoA reductase [Plesiomonas sp.]|uniref:acetoacetyl-CoA reductase n=1 Tax=Plesiomonas sp. TaxID=2486279 RepID=UPI003F2DF175